MNTQIYEKKLLGNLKSPITPIDAIFEIFLKYPGKKWEPTELRDELERLRKENLLDSTAENLLWTTHSVLKRLLEKKYIFKHPEGNKTFYLKSTKIKRVADTTLKQNH